MSKNLTFDFDVDKINKTITVQRAFAASRQLVWDAYTKSEITDQWWAPKPWQARTKKQDFSEGGEWLYAMVGPGGEEHWALARYHKIKPIEYFSAFDAFSDSDGNINESMPQSEWDVWFKDHGDHTIVSFVIHYSELAQLEATIEMGFKEGLSSAMEGLDELLPSLVA